MSAAVKRISRRGLLAGAGSAGATLAGVKDAFAQSLRGMAAPPDAVHSDGAYWAKLRGKFLLQHGLAYLNNGTVGPTPAPVFDALTQYWRMMAENPNENSAILQGRTELIRFKAAQFIGATPAEVAILRNATEGNTLVARGLPLKAGDEVLIGYLEHDSNRQAWQLRAKRDGIVVREVPIGTPPRNPEEILNAFDAAIGPRTRVIAVAHCDTVTGTITPVKELAKLAHSKGLLCAVDGAQVTGMVSLNVADLGVDTYATTSHKWLCAPAGTGLLFVRRELHDRLWPNIATEDWWAHTDARKFDRLSRRPWPVVAALEDAIDFQLAVGRARIEERARSLAAYLRSEAAAIPGVRLYTSNDPRLSGGMTSLGMEKVPPLKLREILRQRYDVYVAERLKGNRYPADPHGVEGIRVSTHFYNTFEQVGRVLTALRNLASGKA